MVIKSIQLKNFRNHKDTRLGLGSGVNVLVGDNAQGKTNLLEAIFLTCVGRGWRTHKDKDLIQFGHDFAKVKTIAQKEYGEVEVDIKLSRDAKKAISINGIPVQKMGELMGQINCVFFSPDELRLVKEAPADRRRFLDIDISQLDKSYFYALLRYNKILAQRNALLKSVGEDIEKWLDIWDVELAKAGTQIIEKRIEFIERLKGKVASVHGFLTNNEEEIVLSYEGVKNDLSEELEKAREKDMRLRTTTIGPHRDDICILVSGKDVRSFASQGQQRTVALSIKLAELEIFKELTGEMPVLLLDDVLSELDAKRQQRLLHALTGVQAVITATQFDGAIDDLNVFNISDGSIL